MVVAVIGDVVGSRDVPDQTRLLAGLATRVQRLPGARSAGATIGDEFQAVFDAVAPAVVAVARLRLELLADPPADRPIELRIGFGVGQIIPSGDAHDAGAPGQSGSAWWAAREGLEHAARPRRGWPQLRWWVEGDADLGPLRATLIGLDTVLARFDRTDVSLARGLLDGRTATQLAEEVGITKQSVSARLQDHGVYGWVRMLEALSGDLS